MVETTGILINVGSVSAPYWQRTMTLKPGQTHIERYVYDSFNLLYASIPDALQVTFGGAAVQSGFSTGMGYKLTTPVEYIQFFNTSDSPLEITFALAVGGITDNRLTVSGVINSSTMQQGFKTVAAGTMTAPQNLTLANNVLAAIVCTSGTITLNMTAPGVNITNLELTAGQSWELPLVSGGTMAVIGTGKFNFTFAEY